MDKAFRKQCVDNGIQFGARAILSGQVECEPPVNLDGEVSMKGVVGAYSYARLNTTLSGVRSIGRYCSIAESVTLGGGEHPTDWLSTLPFQYGAASVSNRWSQKRDHVYALRPKQPSLIKVGHDVWIGTKAVVLRGVTIGNGAIIGAGSVVTKDVPPYAIVAGVPARILRYRFEPELIERMQRVRWWNYTADSLLEVRFNNPGKALDDVERLVAKGAAEPIPDRTVLLTRGGGFTVLDRGIAW